MQDYLIDILVILTFSIFSRSLWIYSSAKKTSQGKLLFKAISLFVLFHLIVFPVIYTVMVKTKPDSILIAENILSSEKEIKLKDAIKVKNEIESNVDVIKQKRIINEILQKNKSILDQTIWEEIDDQKIIFLDSKIMRGHTRYREIPSDRGFKEFDIYDTLGNKIITFNVFNKKQLVSKILIDHLKDLDVEKNKIDKEIKEIESNSFWNYRQVLPYTINILFTDNFNPQSKLANIIYFIHNIIVIGFLLTFIASFFQHYLINNTNSD